MTSFIQKPEVIIWIIIIIIFLISKFGAKLNYLSVFDIIKNHICCFRSEATGNLKLFPILNYFFVPFLMGLSAAFVKEIDNDVINIITIIISILTSMLFVLLEVVIDMKSKINDNPSYYSTEDKISKKALIETYYTVMFEILISVILLVLCFFNIFTGLFNFVQSFVIYGLSFLLVINLLMILKRIFRVIDTDMKK